MALEPLIDSPLPVMGSYSMQKDAPETITQGSLNPAEVQPEFSIIATCCNEEHTVVDFCHRLTATMTATGRTYEVVYVNDGSTDRTGEALRTHFERDARVVLIELDGNVGQWAAISAGLASARGRHFIFIDTDLEVCPEDIPRLIDAFDLGADLVSGERQNRGDALKRQVLSRLGNVVFRVLLGIRSRDMGCGLKVIHGDLVRTMNLHPHRPFRPLPMFAKAKRTVNIPVKHFPSPYRGSAWNLGILLRCYLPAMISCWEDREPFIRCLGWAGTAGGACACLAALFLVGPGYAALLSGGLAALGVAALGWSIMMRRMQLPSKKPYYIVSGEFRH